METNSNPVTAFVGVTQLFNPLTLHILLELISGVSWKQSNIKGLVSSSAQEEGRDLLRTLFTGDGPLKGIVGYQVPLLFAFLLPWMSSILCASPQHYEQPHRRQQQWGSSAMTESHRTVLKISFQVYYHGHFVIVRKNRLTYTDSLFFIKLGFLLPNFINSNLHPDKQGHLK